MNPMQLMQMLKNGGNPERLVRELMSNSQISDNPVAMNAIQMFQKGDVEGLQKTAENLCREKGTTISEVKSFIMQQFGMK